MRSDYTGEELDAIERLTDSAAYAQGAGWQDNGEWESIVCKLHDIITTKTIRHQWNNSAWVDATGVKAELGQPVYYSGDSRNPLGDSRSSTKWTSEHYEFGTQYKMGVPSPLHSTDGAHTFIGDPREAQKRAAENLIEFFTTTNTVFVDGTTDDEGELTETNALIASRQLGRFCFSLSRIEETNHHDVLSAMSNFLIVRAETLYHMNAIEYVAYSDLFEPVEEGCVPPLYLVEIDSDGDVSARESLNS